MKLTNQDLAVIMAEKLSLPVDEMIVTNEKENDDNYIKVNYDPINKGNDYRYFIFNSIDEAKQYAINHIKYMVNAYINNEYQQVELTKLCFTDKNFSNFLSVSSNPPDKLEEPVRFNHRLNAIDEEYKESDFYFKNPLIDSIHKGKLILDVNAFSTFIVETYGVAGALLSDKTIELPNGMIAYHMD